MSLTIHETEWAIAQLPQHDLKQLASWFEEFYGDTWDKQIEKHFDAGRLEYLAHNLRH